MAFWVSLSEGRPCLMLSVSFTCHWTRRKEQRLPMLSEAFNSISWLMTATQKSHISYITRVYGTRLYSRCLSLPPMHADYFWRQSGHIRAFICTQRWLQANKRGNCSCAHPQGIGRATPALLVSGLFPPCWLITDWIGNGLFLYPFFFKKKIFVLKEFKGAASIMEICLQQRLNDSNIPRNLFLFSWWKRFLVISLGSKNPLAHQGTFRRESLGLKEGF